MLKLILADGGSALDATTTLEQSYQASRQDLEEAVAGITQILSNPDTTTEGMPYNGIVINLMADMLVARYQWGRFALDATASIIDDSSAEDKQSVGRTAYKEALGKMERALASGQ